MTFLYRFYPYIVSILFVSTRSSATKMLRTLLLPPLGQQFALKTPSCGKAHMRTQRKACATEFSCKGMCLMAPHGSHQGLPAVAQAPASRRSSGSTCSRCKWPCDRAISILKHISTCILSHSSLRSVTECISDICQSLRPLRKGRSRSSGWCHNKGRSSCESSQSNASDHCGARHGFQISN